MAFNTFNTQALPLLFALFFLFSSFAVAQSDSAPPSECEASAARGECHNKPQALRLKIIAIVTILGASMVGVCLPLFSRSVPALRPDRNLFVLVKAFASGVILATGYMHVLPDSFDDLGSPCLLENPWGKFPFTAFVAMLSAVFTLMVDSLMLSFYNRKGRSEGAVAVADNESPMHEVASAVHGHGRGHMHGHGGPPQLVKDDGEAEKITLRRNRVIAQVSLLHDILYILILEYIVKYICKKIDIQLSFECIYKREDEQG